MSVSMIRSGRSTRVVVAVAVAASSAALLPALGVQSAAVELPNALGSASAVGTPGGLGGVLAENGIEQTVDEWQCAQDSANGYRASMLANGSGEGLRPSRPRSPDWPRPAGAKPR